MSGTGLRYRILRRLGQGGMAEVFEAEASGQLGFVRKVAIKRMLPDAAADGSSSRRFIDEARISSHLHHANIISVIDVGLLDGLPFQVLELVDGINTQQLMQRAGGTLPLEIALIISSAVAHALDHAHRALDASGQPLGVVHRDVKPSNIMISWDGDVKLADFGIAIAHEREAHTETGVVAGTRGFIAPEQRVRSTVDGRTDVFALGLTLHALLSGYTPLQEVTVEIAVLGGEAMPLDPAIPDDVRQLIARAVTPDRRNRPTSGDLATMIGSVLAPRLLHDPRSLLRQFLETHEPRTPRPPASALDQLLGIELELVAGIDGDVACYHAKAEAVTRNERRPTTAPTEASELSTATLGRKRSRWRPLAWMAAGLLLSLTTIFAVSRFMVNPQSVTPSDAAPAITEAHAPPSIAVDASVVLAVDASVVTKVVARAEPAVDAAIRTQHPRRDAGVTSVAPIDRQPPVVTEVGYIQVVGGEALVGAEVIIDRGDYTGSVPNKIKVPLGHHSVEVLQRDGTRLAAQPVEITSFHTLSRPARLTFE